MKLRGFRKHSLNWLNNNSMKANPGKYHLPLFGSDSSKLTRQSEMKPLLIVNSKNFSGLK